MKSNDPNLKLIKNTRDEALIVHYMMLTRQMTKLSDCITHIMRLHTQPDGKHKGMDYAGYRVYAQSELADALVQTRKLCDILDLDFVETYCMGMVRDREKKAEYLETHPNDEWI